MRRRTFDLFASVAGLVLAVVLLVVGVLFQQNANFANDNVKSQLVAQKITFPPGDSLSEEERAQPGIVKYAGQRVDSGRKAEVYANQLIATHLEAVNDGKTYSETSSESRANPDDTALAAKVQTLFRGETLRGLLLTSYAFGTLGDKAQQLAIVFFIGAALFLILAVLGFVHYRRTPPTVEI